MSKTYNPDFHSHALSSSSPKTPPPLILKAQKIKKSYMQGGTELPILKGIDLEVRQGETICIMGSSGAGKSTLLHILGTLDRPTEGEIFFNGQNLMALKDDELASFRNSQMGFVFQFHHLIQEFTALENIMLPLRIGGEAKSEALKRALSLLQDLGLSQRGNHFPSQLSGGELQRVAIARALARRPKILFADEPTGNLDSINSLHIYDIFSNLQKQQGLALIIVTHDSNLARRFGRTLHLSDGRWYGTRF